MISVYEWYCKRTFDSNNRVIILRLNCPIIRESIINQQTAGTRAKRYYGICEHVDKVEQLARAAPCYPFCLALHPTLLFCEWVLYIKRAPSPCYFRTLLCQGRLPDSDLLCDRFVPPRLLAISCRTFPAITRQNTLWRNA